VDFAVGLAGVGEVILLEDDGFRAVLLECGGEFVAESVAVREDEPATGESVGSGWIERLRDPPGFVEPAVW
jgi:hypothetical protein